MSARSARRASSDLRRSSTQAQAEPTGRVRRPDPAARARHDKLATARTSPWNAELVMGNPHLQMRIWKLDKPMTSLARNGDGDQLLFRP